MTDPTGLEIAVIGCGPVSRSVHSGRILGLGAGRTPTLRRFTDAELDAAGVDPGSARIPASSPSAGAGRRRAL